MDNTEGGGAFHKQEWLHCSKIVNKKVNGISDQWNVTIDIAHIPSISFSVCFIIVNSPKAYKDISNLLHHSLYNLFFVCFIIIFLIWYITYKTFFCLFHHHKIFAICCMTYMIFFCLFHHHKQFKVPKWPTQKMLCFVICYITLFLFVMSSVKRFQMTN